jgi:DNA repair photolyase
VAMKRKEALRFKPVALPCGKNGSSRLYTVNLFTGRCPHACVYCYAAGFRDFSGLPPRSISPEAIESVKRWPKRLFLSSASDPFHPVAVKLAEELLRASLSGGSFVVISTKALATPGIIAILSQYPDQVSYTVSLSSISAERNRILEPKAPSAQERLHGKKQNGEIRLCGVEQLARRGIQLTLKADSLFPDLDDTEEAISWLLQEAKACGVRAVNFSYAFYRNTFKRTLGSIPLLTRSLRLMNEPQPIASGTGFSVPLSEKRTRLAFLAGIASSLGYEVISTCACKNGIGWVPPGTPLTLECPFHDRWF